MTIDNDYARTFFDIITISTFNCSLLVPNVHIAVSFLSIFLWTGHFVWDFMARRAHFASGHINAFGPEQGAWCLQGVSYRCDASRVELQRTRETDQSNIAFATTARLNSKPAMLVHNGCTRTSLLEQICVSTSTVSLTPHFPRHARYVPLVLGTRSQTYQRRCSDVPVDNAKRGRSNDHALCTTTIKQGIKTSQRGRGPHLEHCRVPVHESENSNSTEGFVHHNRYGD